MRLFLLHHVAIDNIGRRAAARAYCMRDRDTYVYSFFNMLDCVFHLGSIGEVDSEVDH